LEGQGFPLLLAVLRKGRQYMPVSLRQCVSESTSVSLRRQSVLTVSPRRDVSAVQFRQWDSRSHECYSAHCNCNVCSWKSPGWINLVSNPNPRHVISHTTHPGICDNIVFILYMIYYFLPRLLSQIGHDVFFITITYWLVQLYSCNNY
jgi:hypothetical protein